MHLLIAIVIALLTTSIVFAQESTSVPDSDSSLTVSDVGVSETVDIYGQTVQAAVGELANSSAEDAYTNIALTATAYDSSDEVVGEGFGYLVDACGTALLSDFLLSPAHTQPFTVPLDLFEANATVERVEIAINADTALPNGAIPLPNGITQITDSETISVEWITDSRLRYAVGCNRDLFDQWRWHSYDLLINRDRVERHPYAGLLTSELRELIRLTDPLLFENSRLSVTPDGTRIVYQDGVNRFYTAAADGRLVRQLYGGLNNRSLQGIEWLDGGRFLAYYYGAYGDPVLYFTADAEGRTISPSPLDNRPSVIVPGASRDGRRIVLAGTFQNSDNQDVTGYYIYVVTNRFFELLFEGEPAGVNYPAPLPILNTEEDLVSHVYIARPVDGSPDGMPMLQCFNRETGLLVNLAPLPLQLADGERARMILSPDESLIALTANGAHGGLWLIDLDTLPSCV